jgi:hypothetical protein
VFTLELAGFGGSVNGRSYAKSRAKIPIKSETCSNCSADVVGHAVDKPCKIAGFVGFPGANLLAKSAEKRLKIRELTEFLAKSSEL